MQAKILSWSAMPLFSKSTNLHNLWQKLPIHELTFKAKFVNPRSCSPQQTGGNSSYLNFCKIGLRVNLKKKNIDQPKKTILFLSVVSRFCVWLFTTQWTSQTYFRGSRFYYLNSSSLHTNTIQNSGFVKNFN